MKDRYFWFYRYRRGSFPAILTVRKSYLQNIHGIIWLVVRRMFPVYPPIGYLLLSFYSSEDFSLVLYEVVLFFKNVIFFGNSNFIWMWCSSDVRPPKHPNYGTSCSTRGQQQLIVALVQCWYIWQNSAKLAGFRPCSYFCPNSAKP